MCDKWVNIGRCKQSSCTNSHPDWSTQWDGMWLCIQEISKDSKDTKKMLYEAKHGVKDTSTCSNSVRISSHHSGAIESHEQKRVPQQHAPYASETGVTRTHTDTHATTPRHRSRKCYKKKISDTMTDLIRPCHSSAAEHCRYKSRDSSDRDGL